MILNKFVLCSLAAIALPSGLSGQQLTASVAAVSSLPDAPQPQGAAYAPAASFDAATQSTSQQQSTSQDQSVPPPPAAQTQQETTEQRRARADKQIQEEEHQRIAGVLPAFNSVQNGTAVPLTPGQKFHLFFRGSIDPYQFLIAGVDAGIEQAEDSYPEYGQGVEGLAKRFGAAYADSFDGNFWGNAVLPSLLHQDPRYYRLGKGKAMHRILYAVSTTVVAHGDNGKLQPNYSNVIGNFIGGAISNVYYPASDRGVGLTIERGATTTAEGAIGSLLIEFYPDYIAHRRRKKLAKEAAAREAADGARIAQDPAPPATAPAH